GVDRPARSARARGGPKAASTLLRRIRPWNPRGFGRRSQPLGRTEAWLPHAGDQTWGLWTQALVDVDSRRATGLVRRLNSRETGRAVATCETPEARARPPDRRGGSVRRGRPDGGPPQALPVIRAT